MNGETTGPVFGGLGLAAFAAAVVAVKAHALDTLVATAAPAVGVIVLAGVLAVGLVSAARIGRSAAGRMVAGHTHGPSRTIARHEAGHAAAARALGGRVLSATADRRGGYVDAILPTDDPHLAVTFLRAGRRAAGTGAGCSADDRLVRDELRRVPRGERRQLLRDADRDARRIVRQARSQIQRDAVVLEQRGRL